MHSLCKVDTDLGTSLFRKSYIWVSVLKVPSYIALIATIITETVGKEVSENGTGLDSKHCFWDRGKEIREYRTRNQLTASSHPFMG